MSCAFSAGHDVRCSDAAIQVAFVIRVGFDRHALPGDGIGHGSQTGQPSLFDGFQLRSVLFDHSLVMVGGDGRQSLGQQIVVGVTRPDFDHVTLAAQVFDRLDQQQLDPTVRSLGEPFRTLEQLSFSSLGHGHDELTLLVTVIRAELRLPHTVCGRPRSAVREPGRQS